MNRSKKLFSHFALLTGLLFFTSKFACADGRPGSVEWSDGHKLVGAISLSPGKDFRLFTTTGQVSVQLAEIKELKFTPEKEEMREGFYFPNAGQATQAKTGEIYPTRSIKTEITLADGKVLEGHLFTTTLYVETDSNTEKVVLMAKQTGTDNQKLADLIYPTDVHFDGDAATTSASQIDLRKINSTITKVVAVAKPDLAELPQEIKDGVTIVPVADPTKILFSVEQSNGIHVAWPRDSYAGNRAEPGGAPVVDNPYLLELGDPYMGKALETSLKEMQDFYDTRSLLSCFAEGDDVYSLVMMKRTGPTNGFASDRIPWSLVVLRWKYDSEAKKTTLLNRASFAMGRVEGNSPLPKVLIEPELLKTISPVPPSAPKTTHP